MFKVNLKKQLVKANLKEKDISVIVPDKIVEIGTRAFFGNSHLELVELGKDIIKINECAFFGCDNLRIVYLNKGLESIGKSAFQQCEKLNNIEMPEHLKSIQEAAFAECSSLESINIPSGVAEIEKYAFFKCENLEKVEIPSSVLKIGENAFGECFNIEEIVLGKWNFLFELDDLVDKFEFCYFQKESGKLLLAKEIKGNLEGFEKVEYKTICEQFGYDKAVSMVASIVFGEDKLKKIKNFSFVVPCLVKENINYSNYIEIKECLNNYKEFKGLVKRLNKLESDISDEAYYMLFKFAFSLGAFNEDKIIRQRACEYLYEIYENKTIDLFGVKNIFKNLNLGIYFNEEWANFIIDKNNFKQLLELEDNNPDFISQIYNQFAEIKEFSRSNRGSQRYRKVTVEMCKKYILEMHFDGVNELNQDIADTLKLYAHDQNTFDVACKIREEYLNMKKSKKTKDHILGEALFSILEKKKEEILNDTGKVLKNLNDLANEKFSYEYLSKGDALNFVLGSYCNCCAHLEGVGKGIVEATVLHPDCQSLVIKNEKGEIIAKSSLYVNKRQGYAIFNNVEINDKNLNEDDKELVYIKYMQAVDNFAKKYNKKHPFNPIRQVNVGMTSNKLAYQMRGLDDAEKILSAEAFSKFSDYNGDWRYKQKILWEIDSDLKR